MMIESSDIQFYRCSVENGKPAAGGVLEQLIAQSSVEPYDNHLQFYWPVFAALAER